MYDALLYLLCQVREEELDELDFHLSETCMLPVAGGSENTYGKVNILLQTYVSRGNMESFSLVSDLAYVAQVGLIYRLSNWNRGLLFANLFTTELFVTIIIHSTLSVLNLPLSPSSTTSRELLPQFSTCSG